MKADKKHLTKQIEDILVVGISECEEVDITTEKIIEMIWPYFEYMEVQNKDSKESMQNALDVIEYMNGLTQVPSSDMENYTNRVVNCMAELDNKIRN